MANNKSPGNPRADVKNPNNQAFKADQANRARQAQGQVRPAPSQTTVKK
ncbi:MAG: hypothetical protein AB7K71_17735 [Polyangiaceae bacterium]